MKMDVLTMNWYMEMQILGFNYRLTDFQSALGISSWEEPRWFNQKEGLLLQFMIMLSRTKYIRTIGAWLGHAYHLYVIEWKIVWVLYNFYVK
jgi:dTDP-4-amino-4,6-dideoxygalactose transaminase